MPRPKWMLKTDDMRTMAGKRERKIAKQLGGKTTKNSGANWSTKGDVTLDEGRAIAEIKSTSKKQMVVYKRWLEKVFVEATKLGKEAVFIGDFGSIYFVGRVIKNARRIQRQT